MNQFFCILYFLFVYKNVSNDVYIYTNSKIYGGSVSWIISHGIDRNRVSCS